MVHPGTVVGLSIRPLEKHHNRAAFLCGVPVLDLYLKAKASQDAKRCVAAPFVLVDDSTNEVLGYYTLSSHAVYLKDLPNGIGKKLPRYPLVPATLIGRLAICSRLSRKGFGSFLLLDALAKSYSNIRQVGSAGVVVEAKGQSAITFYKHFGFVEFCNQQSSLFIPMKTVSDLL